MIGLTLFGLSVLSFFALRRRSRERLLRPGVMLLLAFLLLWLTVYGVSLTHLDSDAVEADKTRAAIIYTAYVGTALYAVTRIRTEQARATLLVCLAVGLTVNCVIGLLQVALHQDIRFLPPGFTFNVGDQSRGIAASLHQRYGVERAYGLASHAIEFSVLVAVTVPVTIHFARFATLRRDRVIAGLACGVALLAVPVGVSRSGALALIAGMLVYVWGVTLRTIATGAAVTAVALATQLVWVPRAVRALYETFANAAEDGSIAERISDYTKVSLSFRANPLFGVGLGGSPPSEFGYVDNEWLQSLVQGGLFGLMAMLLMCLGGLFGISAALRAARTPRERDQAYTLGAVFAGIFVSSFTFDLFSHQQAAMLFFLAFGLLWANFAVPVSARTAAPSAALVALPSNRRRTGAPLD
jgi:O-antigen ligase